MKGGLCYFQTIFEEGFAKIQRGLTQSQLVAKMQMDYLCDISLDTYKKIEENKRNMTMTDFFIACKILDIDLKEFCDQTMEVLVETVRIEKERLAEEDPTEQ